MKNEDPNTAAETRSSGKESEKKQREKRLAEQLRRNLHNRKAQARQRQDRAEPG